MVRTRAQRAKLPTERRTCRCQWPTLLWWKKTTNPNPKSSTKLGVHSSKNWSPAKNRFSCWLLHGARPRDRAECQCAMGWQEHLKLSQMIFNSVLYSTLNSNLLHMYFIRSFWHRSYGQTKIQLCKEKARIIWNAEYSFDFYFFLSDSLTFLLNFWVRY